MQHPNQASQMALPRYRRGRPPFEELFGASAHDVLASMDEAGDDVPNAAPACAIDIDAVGLRRRGIVVSVDDPFGSGEAVPAVCTVDVSAGVPATRRGIHVSRIGHVIAEHAASAHRDISSFAEAVAHAVADAQYGRARVTVHARVPFIEEHHADRTGRRKLSLEHLRTIAAHTIHDGAVKRAIGVQTTHLLACPCVQQTFRHAALVAGARHMGAPSTPAMRPMPPMAASEMPAITHSQRCVTRVVVRGVTRPASSARMLAALDEVLCRTSNTLPRDAELALVYRAHREPQFIEDALRAAVDAIAALWPRSDAFHSIAGRSRSLESIHGHDLTAALTLRAHDPRGVRGPYTRP